MAGGFCWGGQLPAGRILPPLRVAFSGTFFSGHAGLTPLASDVIGYVIFNAIVSMYSHFVF